MTVTSRVQLPPSVEIDGRTIETPSYVLSHEALIIGEDVYMMDLSIDINPSYGGDLRQERDDYNDQRFDPFFFFDYHRLHGFYKRGYEADFWLPRDLAAQISVVEQELNGERVYHITGPITIHRAYPLIGASALDGVLRYWIGAEDYLLRRFEISGIDSRGETPQHLNGVITLSDFGEPVDIQRPVHEGPDDHGDSPSTATEIPVGEQLAGSVDSWLDFDYFRFQAEEGQRYEIVVSVELDLVDRAPTSFYGARATLYEPDGVTEASNFSRSSGVGGARIEWQAPASDTYYFKVEWEHDVTVPYTLTVTPVEG